MDENLYRAGVSLVFGGRSPIALACANQLASRNKVFLVTRASGEDLEALVGDAPNIEVVVANLEVVGESRRVVEDIYLAGQEIDSVVFLQRYRPEDLANFAAHCAVELWSIAECLNTIKERKSLSRNVQALISSSPAAEKVLVDQSLEYHIVKSGQEALARFYAATLGSSKISVNTARIGSVVVKKRAISYWNSVPNVMSGLMGLAQSGELQTSEDVGKLFADFVSANLSGLSGQNFSIDDGFSLRDGAQLAKSALEGTPINE